MKFYSELFRPQHSLLNSSANLSVYQSLWYAMNGLLFALILTVPMANASDLEYQKREHQAKALFLYNFANFVEWPTEAFEKPKDPITLCLFGNIPFGNFLDSVNGTLIGERPLTVQRTQDMADIADGCHILFVGDEQRVLLPEFWNQIKYLYVLSVGEQNQFTQRGGIINILRTTDRVQFDVNISNAIANGLFISSDLLALARTIRENTRVRH